MAARRFRVRVGLFYDKDRCYKQGEELVSSHDLVALFPEKFDLVTRPEPVDPPQLVSTVSDTEQDEEPKPEIPVVGRRRRGRPPKTQLTELGLVDENENEDEEVQLKLT
jgi:hypothetical protein